MAEANAGNNQLVPINIHDSDSEDDIVELITPGAHRQQQQQQQHARETRAQSVQRNFREHHPLWYHAQSLLRVRRGVPIMLATENRLRPFCLHDEQWGIVDLVRRNIPYVDRAALNADTLSAGIRYRTDALLIQAAGEALDNPCSACRRRSPTRPFPRCIVLMGYFQGVCGNCRWRNSRSGCGNPHRYDGELIQISDSDSDSDSPPPPSQRAPHLNRGNRRYEPYSLIRRR
ncbi:hypothetical protein ACMFMG_002696 [Clarireedia jacksonii]